MNAIAHEVRFDGSILRRGFWLYVWEVETAGGTKLYYVGRTGDNSSTKAQSPFNRMAQHVGFAENTNMLRRLLSEREHDLEQCKFRLITVGPIEAESRAVDRLEHDQRRDLVAAMEKALAESLTKAGCLVMNRVKCRKPLDGARFSEIDAAFQAALGLVRSVPADSPTSDEPQENITTNVG